MELVESSPLYGNKLTIRYDDSLLEMVFHKAALGQWDSVLDEVKERPELVNATFERGPHAGKTLLWLAAYDMNNATHDCGAIEFIHKLIELNVYLYLDAAPLKDRDRTVLLLLCSSLNCQGYQPGWVLGRIYEILETLVNKDCNINVVSNYSICDLFARSSDDRFFNVLSELIINSSHENLHHSFANILTLLLVKGVKPDSHKKIYSYLLKIMESKYLVYRKGTRIAIISQELCSRFGCSFNAWDLDYAMNFPPTDEKNQLILYLLFYNSELCNQYTGRGQRDDEELDKIRIRLLNVFQTAYKVASYSFQLQDGAPEVRPVIASNAIGIILKECPQLANLPLDIVSDRIWKGFEFKHSLDYKEQKKLREEVIEEINHHPPFNCSLFIGLCQDYSGYT
ncbi:MAG: hypothetical protein JSR46_05115 [Verrucomicrobia bacterium]|nr:hypothetical protein [Verrucomicrobiota bacterium]